jgi:copper(I)-binding protein
MIMARASTTTIMAIGLLLTGCGGSSSAPTASPGPAAEIVVTDAWLRSTPNGLGAAYFDIMAPTDDRLIGASVDPTIAGEVEVHEIAENDGRMVMRQVEGISLRAGEPVSLEPGGFHLMLLDMPTMLAVGERIEIRLVLEVAGSVTILAEVRESPLDMDTAIHSGMDPDLHGSMHDSTHSGTHGDMHGGMAPPRSSTP